MKAKSIGVASIALVAAFALATTAAAELTRSARASETDPTSSGADVTGHPSKETNGVPPGPVAWLNESEPYGPPEWYNASGGPPLWLTLP